MNSKTSKETQAKQAAESPDHGPVTAVIHHHVKPGAEKAYEAWAKKISGVSRRFPGRLNLNIIKPTGNNRTYTLVVHFVDTASLQKWFGSPQRHRLIKQAERLFAHPEGIDIKTGLEFWFKPPPSAPGPAKPWKQFLVTFSALYPTTICVQKILSPLLEKPVWNNIFIRNIAAAITVALLVFVIMPRYTRLVSKWLFR
jgi:antibiotic biosynthesis monooxygenase (ABM) superfamily enzyme